MINQLFRKYLFKLKRASKTLSNQTNDDNLGNNTSNDAIRKKQSNILLFVGVVMLLLILTAINYLQNKNKQKVTKQEDNDKVKVEVAASSLDPDKMWRNHFEENLKKNKTSTDEKLEQINKTVNEKEQQLLDSTKAEIAKLQAEVAFAKAELNGAAVELRRAAGLLDKIPTNEAKTDNSKLGVADLENSLEFDRPKNARIYIPETSFVSGYLLGGIAVSTGINAPDEHATPVVIKLTSKGNLPKNFTTDIATCRILGSSYGDLSSERAIIRAEKLVCIDPKTELVTTSNIAGTIHGSDGMNGIKGKVIATSSKHIKNALLGGIISGLSQSAKGQDGMQISSSGAVSTAKKGAGKIAGEGILSGTSTAAEKVADYYLRMAESMSPVLTVPGGAAVDVVFLKGFFVGELGTHKKILKERILNKAQNNEVVEDE